MSTRKRRIVYESDAPYPAVIKIDPVLPCASCGQPASAAVAAVVYRTEGEGEQQKETASGEWLIKPLCGICAEGAVGQYTHNKSDA